MATDTATNLDFGIKHESAFEAYKVWRSIPVLMRHPVKGKEQIMDSFDDEDFVELVSLKTKKAFAERFDVSQNTITSWEKKLRGTSTFDSQKQWAQKLTNNMVWHMYTHAMKTGDAGLFKLWFELFTDYRESARNAPERPNLTQFTVSVRTIAQG